METFAIVIKDTNQWLNIPDCEESIVEVANGDPFPKWTIDEDNVIRYADRPSWCLNKEDNRLCLSKNPICWTRKGSKLMLDCLQFACQGDSIHCSEEVSSSIELSLMPIDLPRPATSCHLKYDIDSNLSNQWTIQCSIEVEKSYDGTYFMITGFGPGGYSGIQQLHGNHRVALFSLWNNGKTSVELVEAGPQVQVSKFGGEGTGLKAMLDFNWSEDSIVTFRVRGKRIDGHWYCDCHIKIEDGPWSLMATYKRSVQGGPILNSSGFYSFIEDFHRGRDDKGWRHIRKARFLNPTFTDDKGQVHLLKDATFTKQEEGTDAFAKDLALAYPCRSGFVMQTGKESICENWTKLHFK